MLIASSFNRHLLLAIAQKRLIEVTYSGRRRVAEPHDYGVQKGVERLLAFQLSEPFRSTHRRVDGWRLFDVAKIEACAVLEELFSGSRGHAHHKHREWDIVYARVL